jgi:hypothetical protein
VRVGVELAELVEEQDPAADEYQPITLEERPDSGGGCSCPLPRHQDTGRSCTTVP